MGQTCFKSSKYILKICPINSTSEGMINLCLIWPTCIVEAPISIITLAKNLQGPMISNMLGLDFNLAGINSVTTHIFGFDTKVRRNEQLWQTLDIRNMFQANVWLQKFMNKIIEKFAISCDVYLPTWEKFAPPYTSPCIAQNILSDLLWAPTTLE